MGKTLIIGCFLGVALVLGSACGRAKTPERAASPGAVPSPNVPAPPSPESSRSAVVTGRIVGADTGVIWKAGVMEFRPTDPTVAMVAAAPAAPDGGFQIALPEVRFDVPYVVVAFRDPNENNTIDPGEDFLGGRSVAPGYSGKNMFLFTESGTFVGDRSWDLSEVEFVIDVKL